VDLGAGGGAASAGVLSSPDAATTLHAFKDAAERAFLVAKLRAHDWNIAATAKAIDTPRSNLYKKLEAYRISRETDG
jgi:two-component system nitrogen regulation response regulator NtrX